MLNLGFNALLNSNIETVKLDSFKRKTHKRDKKIILLWFENPNRFLNFSHFTEEKRKEEPNEKSVASGILTQLSENPIIETLENRFLDCVNNHFYGSINLCKLKNDWFQCVVTVPHKDQKCMTRFLCGRGGRGSGVYMCNVQKQ